MRDVDQIIEVMRKRCPGLEVRQLQVLHPGADDDGLWFFRQSESSFEVQIESSTGMCPFQIETDETATRITARTIQETIETLSTLLRIDKK